MEDYTKEGEKIFTTEYSKSTENNLK